MSSSGVPLVSLPLLGPFSSHIWVQRVSEPPREMLIFVSVALKLYTSNLLQSRIYHTEQVLCSLYYSMKMVQMVEYCNVFSLNILVAVTKGMSSVNLCSNRIFQLTWGASICIMAVKCWLLSYKVVSCTVFFVQILWCDDFGTLSGLHVSGQWCSAASVVYYGWVWKPHSTFR